MITNVIQRGKYISIYNERGVEQTIISVGTLPGSGLKGFTSQTVSVQQGTTIYTYNEHGSIMGNGIHVSSEFESVNSNRPSTDLGDWSWSKVIVFIILVAALYYIW